MPREQPAPDPAAATRRQALRRLQRLARASAAAALALLLAACGVPPRRPAPVTQASAPPTAANSAPAAPAAPPPPAASAALPDPAGLALRPASFAQLPGWQDDDFRGLWQAWRRDCRAQVRLLAGACAASSGIADDDLQAQRGFFEQWFRPWQMLAPDGHAHGLVTGYFEPVYPGSTERRWPYVVPVWGAPPGLVPMAASAPGQPDRGRVVDTADGQRIVPFWSRAQIEHDPLARQLLSRHVVAWLESPVDALFLQVQGSGLVRLPDGSLLRLSYAGDNGWPYESVGRWLLDRGDLRGSVTMQSIGAWARMHPDQVQHMLDADPRVVFFHAAPLDGAVRGPLGALGVPLTSLRSIAVDKSLLALGVPVWLSTTVNARPLRRLLFAQDVGGAIRGPLRADLFFGTGEAAGQAAGRMQSPARMWVLLPRAADPAADLRRARMQQPCPRPVASGVMQAASPPGVRPDACPDA